MCYYCLLLFTPSFSIILMDRQAFRATANWQTSKQRTYKLIFYKNYMGYNHKRYTTILWPNNNNNKKIDIYKEHLLSLIGRKISFRLNDIGLGILERGRKEYLEKTIIAYITRFYMCFVLLYDLWLAHLSI